MYTIEGIEPGIMKNAIKSIREAVRRECDVDINEISGALLASHLYLSLEAPVKNPSDDFQRRVSQYLQTGLPQGKSPGPLFEPSIVSQSLERIGVQTRGGNLVSNWLIASYEHDIATTAILDHDFYADKNPDVCAAGMKIGLHFALYGVYEGRSPSLIWDQTRHVSSFMQLTVAEQCLARDDQSHKNPFGFHYDKFLPIPANKIEILSFLLRSLRVSCIAIDLTDLAYLLALYCFDDETSDNTSNILDGWFGFLASGQRDKHIGPLFESHLLGEALLWIREKRLSRDIPTQFFNEKEYLELNPDVRDFGRSGFEHYILHGRFEGRAVISEFNRRWADRLLDISPRADSYAAWVSSCVEIAHSPSVNVYETEAGRVSAEEAKLPWQLALKRQWLHAKGLSDVERALEAGFLHDAIERAAVFDPQVTSKNAPRMLVVPDNNESLVFLSEKVRKEFERVCGDGPPDVVILTPMRGIGGAETVSENLFWSLEQIGLRPLIVVTDNPLGRGRVKFDREVDFASICSSASLDERVKILTDMLYGIGCATIININSLVAWEAMRHHGNVLKEEFSIIPFLFCWDFDACGRIQGYISEYFAECLPYCKTVIFDNERIKNDLADMYGIDRSDSKLRVLYSTPSVYSGTAAPLRVDALPAYRSRETAVFWAGRMSQQKRFDLVVSIAAQMPETQFYCWGSSVIPSDVKQHPGNIHMMGHFSEFNEIPVDLCGAWLFTSDYEGLPITLIECAKSGVAVVASDVGGVSELVTNNNGWLITGDIPESYTSALTKALGDIVLSKQKAKNLNEKFQRRHAKAVYISEVRSIWSEICA